MHLQSIFRSTRGIILLGTPHQGDGLTEWAKALSTLTGVKRQTNDAMLEILRRDSEVLARIQDSFCTMITEGNKKGFRPIEVICFFEELPLPGVGFVRPTAWLEF
jgi:protein SERAC1